MKMFAYRGHGPMEQEIAYVRAGLEGRFEARDSSLVFFE
jgi:hypothetical protein